ncbi:hypothetical protein [Nonomuraea helvata]|uniref:Uncharacterized protein n=1 Tax=Nonomuraea helvata TaxID=37484 RepID=A0ABV5SDH2_9ACTN
MTEDLHHDTPPVLLGHSDPDPLTRDQAGSCGVKSLHEIIVSQGRVEPFPDHLSCQDSMRVKIAP